MPRSSMQSSGSLCRARRRLHHSARHQCGNTLGERRQQIGVLRAIGFRRELVSLSFLVETAFVVGLGILSGTALGLRLAYNLMTSDETGSSTVDFMVPWPIILTVLVATVLVALLMTWIPARQAGRIAPAEALRYE